MEVITHTFPLGISVIDIQTYSAALSRLATLKAGASNYLPRYDNVVWRCANTIFHRRCCRKSDLGGVMSRSIMPRVHAEGLGLYRYA